MISFSLIIIFIIFNYILLLLHLNNVDNELMTRDEIKENAFNIMTTTGKVDFETQKKYMQSIGMWEENDKSVVMFFAQIIFVVFIFLVISSLMQYFNLNILSSIAISIMLGFAGYFYFKSLESGLYLFFLMFIMVIDKFFPLIFLDKSANFFIVLLCLHIYRLILNKTKVIRT